MESLEVITELNQEIYKIPMRSDQLLPRPIKLSGGDPLPRPLQDRPY